MGAKLANLLVLAWLVLNTSLLLASREELQPRWQDIARSPSKQVKLRRRQVELAVNRLHILESLDGQLEKFAELGPSVLAAGSQLQSAQLLEQQQQLFCSLKLTWSGPSEQPASAEPASCLESAHLRRRLPVYMLNLRRRLLAAQASQPALAVRSLMPYRSAVVRSFAQPSVNPQGKFSG